MIHPPSNPLPVDCPVLSRASLRKRRGFTLIETALALGIVAFALLPLMGMLPLGIQVSNSAADLMMSAQIAQRLTGMIQQADFSTYTTLTQSYYYFDREGQPVKTAAGGAPSPTAVYSACILVPPTATTLVDGVNVATVNLQIVNDPAHRLQGVPVALPAQNQAHPVLIPVYLVNNGS